MKKAVIFLSVFFLTLIIGYVAVPHWTKKVEFAQVEIVVEKEQPIIQKIQPPVELIDESVEYDWERVKKFRTKALETGSFWTDDVTGKSGETWFGLFEQGKSFKLVSTKILVKKILKSNPSESEVATVRKGRTVFLIKDVKGLSEGEVKTVYLRNEDDYDEFAQLKYGSQKDFEFNGEKYNLHAENKLSTDEYPSKGSKLILSANGKGQVLTGLKENCNDCSWSIYWVGDLDKDGKLDFYLDLSDHYNKVDMVLFLSSKADRNKLVKAVANFSIIGC
jgi:hypothetical protein